MLVVLQPFSTHTPDIFIRPTVILASKVNEDAAKIKVEGSENTDGDKEILDSTSI
jgi:hypothetical protein